MARKECPAFGKKCHNCGMENHFTTVCERRSKINHIGTDDEFSTFETDDDISESSAAGLVTDSDGDDIPSHNYAADVKRQGFYEGRPPKSPGKERV